MALAPLSQTIFLTEDGSTPVGEKAVTIPPPLRDPPIITAPADITDDGTPQVGEPLTGLDPVATNATYGNRRWLSGTTILARTSIYTPTAAGVLDWLVDVIGTDGVTVLTSAKRVTVVAIPVPDPTLDNTFADNSTIALGAVPGLLTRMNSLIDRLAAVGIAAADPDIYDLVADALADLAAAIAAIDLHRPLSAVLTEMEAKMTAIEKATIPPPPIPTGIWHANSADIFANGTDWLADGTRSGGGGTTPVQNFSFGPSTGVPGEGGSEVLIQNFSFGPPIGSAGDGADAIQNFTFGAAGTQPDETADPVQHFAFGAATTIPSE